MSKEKTVMTITHMTEVPRPRPVTRVTMGATPDDGQGPDEQGVGEDDVLGRPASE